jgi:hypothetical protein
MEDFRILINIAMAGKVCQGKLPRDGYYDMIVSDLKMCEEPLQGGWQGLNTRGTTHLKERQCSVILHTCYKADWALPSGPAIDHPQFDQG